jgi:hypothetical protein
MPLGFAAITERSPVIAYLGLGANLGDPRRQLAEALERLNTAEEVEVNRVSTFYRNPPLGPANQPWYVNAAARVRTRLTELAAELDARGHLSKSAREFGAAVTEKGVKEAVRMRDEPFGAAFARVEEPDAGD